MTHSEATAPYALHRGEGRVYELANGNRVELKAGARETAGRVTILEAGQVAGTGPPLHVHDDVDELFYVLDGRYAITCGADVVDALPGSVVFVPRGTPHRYETRSDDARLLLIYVPGGFEGYFAERSAEEARAGGALDARGLDAIGRRYGMRVVSAES